MVRKPLFLILALSAMAYADTGFKSTIAVTETDGSPSCQAGQIKFSAGSVTCAGNVATVTSGGGASTLPLPSGDTSYIQNNPASVQTATMSITGVAKEDHDLYNVYTSSPTGFADGNIILAKDPTNTFPCFFFWVNGSRYHMCGCPDTGPSTNTGQCMGLLCGVTYQ